MTIMQNVNNFAMAYDDETLEILHGLTPEGKEQYQKMLEQKADEILFKSQHPLRWAMKFISEAFA